MAQTLQSKSAQITAQQLETWERFSPVYADLTIGKTGFDATTQQVLVIARKHGCATDGSQFLDIASSAGQPAVPLAKEFPRVQVVSTDLSPTAVKLAAARGEELGLANFRAEVADSQDLSPFADGTFALVTCTFGMMFIPEYQSALSEVQRVLQPGGLFAMSLWAEEERSENVQLFTALNTALLQSHPDWPTPTPPRLADGAEWQQRLVKASFGNVALSEYAQQVHFEVPDLIEFMVGPRSQFAPLLDKLQAAGQANIHQEAPQILKDLCQQRGWVRDGHVYLNNTAVLVTGVKP